ncbi:MAG: ATP-binding protein [Pseudomonadota bacterium]
MDATKRSSVDRGPQAEAPTPLEDGYWEEVWRPRDAAHLADLITGLSQRLEPTLVKEGFEAPELRIRTVLEEMAVNAWLHGNGENPEKTIVVRWRCGEEFHLEVGDEGPGFDPACAPDPTTSENLTKPCGRGIFIIKYFSDHVGWRDGGRRVLAAMRKPFAPSA